MNKPIIFEQYMKFWKFSIFSFVRQLSQHCAWAEPEHYVRTNITDPYCYIWLRNFYKLCLKSTTTYLHYFKLAEVEDITKKIEWLTFLIT